MAVLIVCAGACSCSATLPTATRSLQGTPPPSLNYCDRVAGATNLVDVGTVSDDAPLLVLTTPYAGFALTSAHPTLAIWRNGDVLYSQLADDSRKYYTHTGHIEPAAAIALVAGVVRQLAQEPAFHEPNYVITDQPMTRLYAALDGTWHVWSVYGWWPDELLHPEQLETEWQTYAAQKPELQSVCNGNFDGIFNGRPACDAPRLPPPAKFAAVYRRLTALRPAGDREFEPARYTLELFDAGHQPSVLVRWPTELPALPATLSPQRCSLTTDVGESCQFDLDPANNARVIQFEDELKRVRRRAKTPVLHFAGNDWNLRIASEYRGEREFWRVAACAARVGVTQER